MLAAMALLCPSSLGLGGVGIYASEDRRIFLRSEPNINYIRARILHLSKASDYTIINSKGGDDHRSQAENTIAHAF